MHVKRRRRLKINLKINEVYNRLISEDFTRLATYRGCIYGLVSQKCTRTITQMTRRTCVLASELKKPLYLANPRRMCNIYDAASKKLVKDNKIESTRCIWWVLPWLGSQLNESILAGYPDILYFWGTFMDFAWIHEDL